MKTPDADWLEYSLPKLLNAKEERFAAARKVIKESLDWLWRVSLVSAAIYFLAPLI